MATNSKRIVAIFFKSYNVTLVENLKSKVKRNLPITEADHIRRDGQRRSIRGGPLLACLRGWLSIPIPVSLLLIHYWLTPYTSLLGTGHNRFCRPDTHCTLFIYYFYFISIPNTSALILFLIAQYFSIFYSQSRLTINRTSLTQIITDAKRI